MKPVALATSSWAIIVLLASSGEVTWFLARAGEPPAIVDLPPYVCARAGSDVFLSPSVTGTPPLLIQWQCQGAVLPGATNATLALPNVQSEANGDYCVTVINDLGVATAEVELSVNRSGPHQIHFSPNQDVAPESPVQLEVTARGSEPLRFQWRLNGVYVEGATGNVLRLPAVRPSDQGYYSVTVANSFNTVEAAGVWVTLQHNDPGLRCVSVSSTGTQADRHCDQPSISADGRFVAFLSRAATLCSAGPPAYTQVYVHDCETGQTELISVGLDGLPGDADSHRAIISADGGTVAFCSSAQNLIAHALQIPEQVYARDRRSRTTWLVSVTPDEAPANAASCNPDVTSDGRFVAFESRASDLLSAGEPASEGPRQVFVRDQIALKTQCLSVTVQGLEGNHDSFDVSISADGQVAAFASSADNLLFGDPSTACDVLLCERGDGTLQSLSTLIKQMDVALFPWDVIPAQRVWDSPHLNSSGTHIAFRSQNSDLLMGVRTLFSQCVVYDIANGRVTLGSVSSAGEQANRDAWGPRLSADARYVVFASDATNLVSRNWVPAAVPTRLRGVYLHDLQTGATTPLDARHPGMLGTADSESAVVSADGRFVAFTSQATNLVSADMNTAQDVFRCEVPADVIEFASTVFMVSEGKGEAVLTVRRTGDLRGTACVSYATVPGNAKADADYRPTNGVAIFAPEQYIADIRVALLPDADQEGPESFSVTVTPCGDSSKLGVVAEATVLICDDDATAQTLAYHDVTLDYIETPLFGGITFDGPDVCEFNPFGTAWVHCVFTMHMSNAGSGTAWVSIQPRINLVYYYSCEYELLDYPGWPWIGEVAIPGGASETVRVDIDVTSYAESLEEMKAAFLEQGIQFAIVETTLLGARTIARVLAATVTFEEGFLVWPSGDGPELIETDPDPPSLMSLMQPVSLVVTAPSSIDEFAFGTCSAIATLANGANVSVTPVWRCDGYPITDAGRLGPGMVCSNRFVEVTATYSDGWAVAAATNRVQLIRVAPAPSLSPDGWTDTGGFRMLMHAGEHRSVRWEASRDLLNWIGLGGTTDSAVISCIIDPEAGGERYRFYRAVEECR